MSVLASLVPESLLAPLFETVLRITGTEESDEAARTALAGVWDELTPRLSPGQLSQALKAVLGVPAEAERLAILAELAPHLDEDQAVETLAAALDAAGDEQVIEVLVGLVPRLPGPALARVVAMVLPGSQAAPRGVLARFKRYFSARPSVPARFGQAKNRTRLLTALVPHITPEQVQAVLADAVNSQASPELIELFKALADRLPEPLDATARTNALNAALTLQSTVERARGIAAVAAILDGELLVGTWEATLKLAEQAMFPGDRSAALAAFEALVSPLPAASLAESFPAILVFPNQSICGGMIEALAPHLPPELIGVNLPAVAALADRQARWIALYTLANYLPADSLPQALAIISEIEDGGSRADGLAHLLPHLEGQAREEVQERLLAALLAARPDEYAPGTVALVAGQLDPDRLAWLLPAVLNLPDKTQEKEMVGPRGLSFYHHPQTEWQD